MNTSKYQAEKTLQSLFESRIERLLSPLENFIHKQTTASIFLAFFTILAVAIANSPWDHIMETLKEIDFGFVINNKHFLLPLKEWINSGLMALFFFLIGLELKREAIAGQLQHPQKITLIIFAAIGGMIFPSLIYLIFNYGTYGARGWAIPIATDTAFAIGVLAFIAKKVSYGTSIFLGAMAIFDDIGAIIILSTFYAHDFHIVPLFLAALVLGALFFLNYAGSRSGIIYALFGIILWLLIYNSGVHATLAGLLLAVAVPARAHLSQDGFLKQVRGQLRSFENEHKSRRLLGINLGILGSSGQHSLTSDIEKSIKDASTPLQRWETSFIYPIGLAVVPIFALFNAGVSLAVPNIEEAMSSRVSLGIIAGLVIGKPLGVSLMVYLGLKLKVGKLPEGMHYKGVVGAGMLGGIGFTMSLFIANLSFEHHPEIVEAATIGIFVASLLSAFFAILWFLVLSLKKDIP